MSDTVKLIIKIPKPMYESVQNGTYCGTLYKELKNGIPLDDVKAEIEAGIDPLDDSQENIAMIRAYNKVIDIIYKHIGKAESEVKPNETIS